MPCLFKWVHKLDVAGSATQPNKLLLIKRNNHTNFYRHLVSIGIYLKTYLINPEMHRVLYRTPSEYEYKRKPQPVKVIWAESSHFDHIFAKFAPILMIVSTVGQELTSAQLQQCESIGVAAYSEIKNEHVLEWKISLFR